MPERRDPASPRRPLTGRQRTHLRGLAHALSPAVPTWTDGVTDAVIAEVDAALEARELVKVRLHDPEDKRQAARELAARTDSETCGLVGHTVILYRPHPDKPRIVVPT